ncbi:MAG TPA: M48 family metalloprotease [Terriglobales bacterium]|nr:M48 family metalloprotease [Terriglobales bacterium]
MNSRALSIAVLVLGLAASAAAQFPRLPDSVTKHKDKLDKAQKVAEANKPWTPEQEQAFGEATAAKLIHQFGLYENPDMTKYVNLVGNAVARAGARTDIQYHFAILDTEVVNAMAAPGGYIFITRGALSLMDNESELAGVLAHEVAHVDGRHVEREVRQKSNMTFIVQEGKNTSAAQSAANSIPGGQQLLQAGATIVTQLLTAPYGRAEESEADTRGLAFASAAGYAPAGLRDFLQALSDQNPNPQKFSILTSTHPPLANRIAAQNALLATYTDPGQPNKPRFDKFVNPRTFAGMPPGTPEPSVVTAGAKGATPAAAAPQELDGVVGATGGSVTITGGKKLKPGTRVKVRPAQ